MVGSSVVGEGDGTRVGVSVGAGEGSVVGGVEGIRVGVSVVVQ